MYRVSQRGEGIDDAGTIEGAPEIVRGQPPALSEGSPFSSLEEEPSEASLAA